MRSFVMQPKEINSKMLKAIIIFVSAVFGSFVVLNISNHFIGEYSIYIMSAFWIIVGFAEFCISLSAAKSKWESLILSGSMSARFIYLLYRISGLELNNPSLTSDALAFWSTAEKYYSGDYSVKYNMFPYLICGEFYIWGKNLFCCLLFNTILGYLSCVVFLALLNRFDLKNKTRLISLSIVAFLPYNLIICTSLAREPIYHFFIICSFYFFTDYILTSKTKSLYGSLISMIPVLIFHIGFFPAVLIYMLTALIKSFRNGMVKKPSILFHFLLFIALLGLIKKFESMDYLIGNDVNHFGYFISKISGIINHKYLMEANSAYLLGLVMDSWWKFLLIAPIKLLYFIFSPLPPYWYNIKQLLSFLFDSTIHILIIICVVYYFKNSKSEVSKTKESSIICYGLLILFAGCFVFALGTSNAGTAIRHRDVFIGIETFVFALCFDKIRIPDICEIKLDNRKRGIILAVILIVQVHFLIYTGAQKQEFYIDEIQSYTISNSYNADKITNDDRMWNTWITGNDLHDHITVRESERFSFPKVYRNSSMDFHPPLYYWILHSVCSLTPGSFNKWSGLSINLVLFVLTAVLIYLISDELIRSVKMKYLPVILWGFSGFAVDTCMFIKMYMLLTTLTVYYVYIHVRMIKHGITRRRMMSVWVTVFIGAMTHYFSLIIVLWGMLFFTLYLIRRKEIGNMLVYGVGTCSSVGLMFLCYPYLIKQILDLSDNNTSNQTAKDLFSFEMWYKQIKELVEQFVLGTSYNELISKIVWSILILILIVLMIINIKNNAIRNAGLKHKETFWIIVISLLTFISVAVVGGVTVSIRYVFFIVPLFYIVLITMFENLFQIKKWHKTLSYTTAIIMVLFAFFNAAYGTSTKSSAYLFRENAYQISRINTYSEIPLVVITEKDMEEVFAGNLGAFELFDDVYISPKDDLDDDILITSNPQKNSSCIAYIMADELCPEGHGYDLETTLNELFEESDMEYEFITNGRFGKYYYIHK